MHVSLLSLSLPRTVRITPNFPTAHEYPNVAVTPNSAPTPRAAPMPDSGMPLALRYLGDE